MRAIKYYALLIALLVTVACQNRPPENIMEKKEEAFFEKSYIDTHNGYSEAVVVTTEQHKTLYISGQVGEGPDLDSQMRSALSKLKMLLQNQGATTSDVVKMNTYIVDYGPESLEIFRRVRKEELGDTDMPASTLVGVESLALPEWLIEIEAIAILPNGTNQ